MLQANVIKLNIPYTPAEHGSVVTISIGCATLIPNERLNPEDLIKLADEKLYLSKESRINHFPLNQLSYLA
jgi:PleD family two-component response regulator